MIDADDWKTFKNNYDLNRPSEPYFSNEKPEEWFGIVQYAEENLEKAFEAGFRYAQKIILSKIDTFSTDVLVLGYDQEEDWGER